MGVDIHIAVQQERLHCDCQPVNRTGYSHWVMSRADGKQGCKEEQPSEALEKFHPCCWSGSSHRTPEVVWWGSLEHTKTQKACFISHHKFKPEPVLTSKRSFSKAQQRKRKDYKYNSNILRKKPTPNKMMNLEGDAIFLKLMGGILFWCNAHWITTP